MSTGWSCSTSRDWHDVRTPESGLRRTGHDGWHPGHRVFGHLPLFEGCGLSSADNTSAIVEFQVDDVDQDRARLGDRVEILQEPTTMPWGNRALMLADPDGNRVNLYTPVSDEAIARFTSR